MKPDNVKPLYAATLTLLLASLMGCAHNSQTPTAVLPTLPPQPSLSTPLPTTSYSLTAADAIKKYREKQMATRLMSEPSLKPGQ